MSHTDQYYIGLAKNAMISLDKWKKKLLPIYFYSVNLDSTRSVAFDKVTA
ncbi:hypothetical protein [Risungbinella massiliensis]|nr:hypothetical protein [Risungbinella massiliensis]